MMNDHTTNNTDYDGNNNGTDSDTYYNSDTHNNSDMKYHQYL